MGRDILLKDNQIKELKQQLKKKDRQIKAKYKPTRITAIMDSNRKSIFPELRDAQPDRIIESVETE